MNKKRTPKRVGDSRTELIRNVMPGDLNGANRLFGGQLMKWIDEVAGITACRHCNGPITTASIDNLRFREPVFNNQLVVLVGKITYVGRTSMEVRVDSFVEDLKTGNRKLINTAFVNEIALDKDGRPTEVPGLLLETGQEKAEFEAGARRRELRMTMGKELYI